MHFCDINELPKKIDRNGIAALVARGFATVLIGIFFLSTALTMDPILVLCSVLCLSLCWVAETSFKVRENLFQRMYDGHVLATRLTPKKTPSAWLREMLFSLNGLFYFLAIFLHGVLYFLIG